MGSITHVSQTPPQNPAPHTVDDAHAWVVGTQPQSDGEVARHVSPAGHVPPHWPWPARLHSAFGDCWRVTDVQKYAVRPSSRIVRVPNESMIGSSLMGVAGHESL